MFLSATPNDTKFHLYRSTNVALNANSTDKEKHRMANNKLNFTKAALEALPLPPANKRAYLL